VADVINYVKATEFSTQRLRELPLCNRLLKETHAILMEGVRGQEKNLLVKPALYISYFLKKNRVEYYDRMTEVRIKGNYEQWIRFFLDALVQSASDASETIMKLLSLHEKNSDILNARARNSKHLLTLFSYVESNPIIHIQKTAKALGLSYGGASGAVKRLMEAGILVQMNGNRRNRVFAYQAYLDILREGTEM